MSWAAVAVAAATVVGGAIQARGARKGAEAQAEAAREGVDAQTLARESFEEKTEPFRMLGVEGAGQLQSFLEDPNQQLEDINPVVDFLRQQGFEQIQESAAAQGRLGAGGTLKDLTQFNTDLTSTIIPQLQNQRFNQLFNVAGLGANVAAGQGTAGLQTATNISNLRTQEGAARAGGIAGQTDAITGGIENLSRIPGAFPGLFNQTPPPPTVPRTGGPAPVVDISTFG